MKIRRCKFCGKDYKYYLMDIIFSKYLLKNDNGILCLYDPEKRSKFEIHEAFYCPHCGRKLKHRKEKYYGQRFKEKDKN